MLKVIYFILQIYRQCLIIFSKGSKYLLQKKNQNIVVYKEKGKSPSCQILKNFFMYRSTHEHA